MKLKNVFVPTGDTKSTIARGNLSRLSIYRIIAVLQTPPPYGSTGDVKRVGFTNQLLDSPELKAVRVSHFSYCSWQDRMAKTRDAINDLYCMRQPVSVTRLFFITMLCVGYFDSQGVACYCCCCYTIQRLLYIDFWLDMRARESERVLRWVDEILYFRPHEHTDRYCDAAAMYHFCCVSYYVFKCLLGIFDI